MSFLYDQSGKRKYLTIEERKAFLRVAGTLNPTAKTFCTTLAYIGARISEVLSLTHRQIDYGEGLVVTKCLKKHRDRIYRHIPVSEELLTLLHSVHKINAAQKDDQNSLPRIWP